MYCKNCGQKLDANTETSHHCEASANVFVPSYNQDIKTEIPTISKRNLAGAVIFTILTCGLFAIAWLYWITNDTKKISQNKNVSTIPFTVSMISIVATVILMPISSIVFGNMTITGLIIGLGILIILLMQLYLIYWSYIIGKNLYLAGSKYNKDIKDRRWTYLICAIVLLLLDFITAYSTSILRIIFLIVIQNDLNKLGVEKQKTESVLS